MAEFCTYCAPKMWGEEVLPDIDVVAIAECLPHDTYSLVLCEGCGMAAIGKDKDDTVLIAMPTGNSVEDENTKDVNWITLDEYKKIKIEI
jgi:hypothetical protein